MNKFFKTSAFAHGVISLSSVVNIYEKREEIFSVFKGDTSKGYGIKSDLQTNCKPSLPLFKPC